MRTRFCRGGCPCWKPSTIGPMLSIPGKEKMEQVDGMRPFVAILSVLLSSRAGAQVEFLDKKHTKAPAYDFLAERFSSCSFPMQSLPVVETVLSQPDQFAHKNIPGLQIGFEPQSSKQYKSTFFSRCRSLSVKNKALTVTTNSIKFLYPLNP